MFKLINGQWPTQAILHRCGKSSTPLCLRCSTLSKYNDHALCCSTASPFRSAKWHTVASHLKPN
jgi:hypothetical protein